MTKLLASVTGPDEAETALEGGADIIDLKDPAKGALGAVSPAVLADTIARVAGRRPVSAVAGDLPMELGAIRAAILERRTAAFVKIGLFPASRARHAEIAAGLSDIASEIPLVAVLFADGAPDFTLVGELAAAGFEGAMIDTMEKSGGGLLKHLSVADLEGFVARCRAAGLFCGLAGSLEPPDVPRLGALRPDYLGFRGALTSGRREDGLSLEAVSAIRRLIDRENHSGSGSAGIVAPPTDRIFVRDFTLEMEIGAYGFERGRRQSVRFGVEADVLRGVAVPVGVGHVADEAKLPSETAKLPSEMVDIYSYDLIMDAVRGLVARGHTDLVETLAEELAAQVLADRRVLGVTVRVEKLALGPGAVGIEIRRDKAG